MGLLLLDLDDTLLDTSGQLAPQAHREAVLAMMAAGLPGDFATLLQQRRDLMGEVPPELLAQAQIALYPQLSNPGSVAESGRRAYFERDVGDIHLEAGVMEMLRRLKLQHSLILVTAGHQATQWQKVTRLGLDWLDEIHIVESGKPSKQLCFAEIATRLGFPPHEVCVVGDRPDVEIAAGRALGMWTLRVCRGEHVLRSAQPGEEAHLEVQTVLEIEGGVARLERQQLHRLGGLDPHQT